MTDLFVPLGAQPVALILKFVILKSFNPTMSCGSLIHLTIVFATERSQLNHIEIRKNTLVFEGDSAGFFQWQQL